MPESPRRVGQRANQGRWRGVAVSQGGESRNGGRGPGERGWGRSALRGVWLCGISGGGPREETPCGEGRLVGLSVAEGDRTRPGEQQVPAGGPRREAPGPAAPPPPHPLPRASRGPGGLGGAPSVADRQWPGERSARGGLLFYTSFPWGGGVLEVPSETWRGRRICEAAKVPPSWPGAGTNSLCDLGQVTSLSGPQFPYL